MYYKVGDFVRFVEEQHEGYVTSIIDDEMIGVTDEDGFEIPVLAAKVTKVYGRMESEEEETLPPEKEGPFLSEGLFLAIMGDQPQGLVEFYLLNESSFEVLFSMGTGKGKQVKGERSGILDAQAAEKIYTANASSVGDWPVFSFQFLFHTPLFKDAKRPLLVDRKIRPVDFSTPKTAHALLGGKAWLFRLDEPLAALDTEKLKEHFISHRPKKKS